MSSKSISPNHREILSARSTITGNQEYLTSTNGALTIAGGGATYTEGATTSPASITIAGGRYIAADPTLTNNQLYGLRFDAKQRLLVNTAALDSVYDSVTSYLAASAVGGYTYTHISTSTTTLIKGSSGTLHTISVNSKGTVASTITVYDSATASGTIIAIIDSLNLSGSFRYDIAALTAITVVTTGTVAPDVTVSWK